MRHLADLFLRVPLVGYGATFLVGAAVGITFYALYCNAGQKAKLKLASQKLQKLRDSTCARVHWKAMDKDVLGLAPRLWMEVLDKKHRYASLLHKYWQRWQLSDSRDEFFYWLDFGQGSMIDLPYAPRRLLDEWRVTYLQCDEQPLFRVQIEAQTGRFVWEIDGSPVTAPQPLMPLLPNEEKRFAAMTDREQAVASLFMPRLETSRRRDNLLLNARSAVEREKMKGQIPTPDSLAEITAPLVAEGLLCQLRDPHFAERHDAAATLQGHAHLRAMKALPVNLLQGCTWDGVLAAIDHDQGLLMPKCFPTREARYTGKGIFVLDSYGTLYCGTKLQGIFHHSSFVRGHCVKVAGGASIIDGWLVELSPHSGHYQPLDSHIEQMLEAWRKRGVDFSNVKVAPYEK